ncbi:MAG: bifunctional 5,10-methylene-tetrahydrofolate dehydrogenase/5,10-methylene-tetrahydrofolate cyclohydrolase [Oscillospiraceae bacterium]|nr:bifunctional 5,10-methylene-tetrahydrofolate dehydrogenase/5,10-methylene-tetrahydrofolate cyclohydrolase [Oscillospiraceae bacterium]
MDNKLISGKVLAAEIKEKIKKEVQILSEQGVYPRLAVIIVGENPASQAYVRGKHKDCAECGIISDNITMAETVTQEELLAEIDRLNKDDSVHGILVQLPLPGHIEEYAVINAISPEKDVDGFTASNVGNMNIGKDCFAPCTPQGCIDMLDRAGVDLEGKDVVVIGRSNIVGKPVAVLALQRSATVTICHSKTKNIAEKTKQADVVIVAVGREKFLTGDMLKEGAVVIDVGINRNSDGKMCGDADFDSCIDVVSKITPVPGGVGLMTRANLLKNTVKSAKNSAKQRKN